jgi:hypothetical protein
MFAGAPSGTGPRVGWRPVHLNAPLAFLGRPGGILLAVGLSPEVGNGRKRSETNLPTLAVLSLH